MARNHEHDKIFIIKIPSNLHTQQQCYAWLTSPLQIFTTCINITDLKIDKLDRVSIPTKIVATFDVEHPILGTTYGV